MFSASDVSHLRLLSDEPRTTFDVVASPTYGESDGFYADLSTIKKALISANVLADLDVDRVDRLFKKKNKSTDLPYQISIKFDLGGDSFEEREFIPLMHVIHCLWEKVHDTADSLLKKKWQGIIKYLKQVDCGLTAPAEEVGQIETRIPGIFLTQISIFLEQSRV